jgi:hypothetical protein
LVRLTAPIAAACWLPGDVVTISINDAKVQRRRALKSDRALAAGRPSTVRVILKAVDIDRLLTMAS